MLNFFQKIDNLFGFLKTEHNVIEKERIDDKENFGNSKIVFVADKFKLVFIRDRDFDFVSLIPAYDSSEEFDLHLVEAYLKKKPIAKTYLQQCNLSTLAKFMRHNYEKIEQAFSKNEYSTTRQCLKKLENDRYNKILKRG